MDLDSKGLDVVGSVRSSGKIRQVKLNLIPALIESHWHGTDEWLHTSRTLVVGRSESSAHVLIIQNLDFESEIFL